MPLLVGLLDTAAHRDPATTHGISMSRRDQPETNGDIDIENLAKQRTGGGMLDGIANMANSILGAGRCSELTEPGISNRPRRYNRSEEVTLSLRKDINL
jgi:hypothetical protein